MTVVPAALRAYPRAMSGDRQPAASANPSRTALFWRVPFKEKALAAVALLLIGLATAVVTLLPMRLWRWILGRSVGAIACTPLLNERQINCARLLRTAIARGASVAPYRSDCLPQALTGAVLCKFYGVPSAIHFGTRPGDSTQLLAHAWLAAGPIAVTGGQSWGEFSVVACFVRP